MAGSVGIRCDTLKARRQAGGFGVADLARRTNLSDWEIQNIEDGDPCRPDDLDRLLNVLGPAVAITSSSIANPSEMTVATHLFQTGDSIAISGHAGSTPNINSTYTITRVSGTVFSIPVNVTGGGTGGVATIQRASIGAVGL